MAAGQCCSRVVHHHYYHLKDPLVRINSEMLPPASSCSKQKYPVLYFRPDGYSDDPSARMRT